MIGDILLKANDVYNFPSMLDSKDFLELDDTILTRIKYHPERGLDSCRDLLSRIENRQIYKQIYSTNHQSVDEVKDLIEDRYQNESYENFHICKMNFDFCNGNESPFRNIHFYKNENTPVLFEELNIRKLIPDNFKESIITVYRKNLQ